MDISTKTHEIDVLILCGGEGRRLHSVVSDRPKPMAAINGRPFLDILIEYVAGFGFKHFILCIGYRGQYIKEYFQKKKNTLHITFSEEKDTLGTGGAVKNAEPLITHSPVLIMNGDSLCEVNLYDFLQFHIKMKGLISLLLVEHAESLNECGRVVVNNAEKITKFYEKNTLSRSNLLNGGIYFFEKRALSDMPADAPFSLEYDFFPKMIHKGLYGYITKRTFIDIGTPERYIQAQQLFKLKNNFINYV